MGAIPNAGPYVEFSIEGRTIIRGRKGSSRRRYAEDGKVEIPDGPGWGVEINQAWLAASRYQKSEL